jgi:hypothetical protein
MPTILFQGGMARLVFINYKSVGDYMVPTDYNADDSTERQMISQVISASLSEKPANESLLQPVVFTLKIEKVDALTNILREILSCILDFTDLLVN